MEISSKTSKKDFDNRNCQINVKNRIEYIDVTRTIAIISITCNHAVNRSFNVASDSFSEFNNIPIYLTLFKVVVYMFSRIGVPLFLMISGALLLHRDYTDEGKLNRFLKHNWLSLLITTEIWLFIMYWYRQLSPDSALFSKEIGFSILNSIATLFFINPDTMGSMWYMEMILCVYLLIPVLSVAIKKLPEKYLVLPSIIVIICSYVIPTINGILVGSGKENGIEFALSSNNVFSMYVVYLLCGYYINNGSFSKIKTTKLLGSMILSLILFCVLQTWVWSTQYDYEFATSYKDIFILIGSICLFELLKRIKIIKSIKTISQKLAPISFGIYFIHICIMEGLKEMMNRYCPNVVHLEKFIILECVSFLGSVVIIHIFRKNRYIAKYLFGMKS